MFSSVCMREMEGGRKGWRERDREGEGGGFLFRHYIKQLFAKYYHQDVAQ